MSAVTDELDRLAHEVRTLVTAKGPKGTLARTRKGIDEAVALARSEGLSDLEIGFIFGRSPSEMPMVTLSLLHDLSGREVAS